MEWSQARMAYLSHSISHFSPPTGLVNGGQNSVRLVNGWFVCHMIVTYNTACLRLIILSKTWGKVTYQPMRKSLTIQMLGYPSPTWLRYMTSHFSPSFSPVEERKRMFEPQLSVTSPSTCTRVRSLLYLVTMEQARPPQCPSSLVGSAADETLEVTQLLLSFSCPRSLHTH